MITTKFTQLTFGLLIMVVGLSCAYGSELDLTTGTVEISGKDSIQLNNLTLGDKTYNAEVQFNLDNTYSVISSMLVETSGTTTLIEQTANYEVTFESTWSSDTHPDNFPSSSAHFSGLIGATHNAFVNFWKEGELASSGIESMAETGSKSLLMDEVNVAINNGTANQVLSGGGLSTSPASISLSFQTTSDFPYVTLVSMIAPSPDWFIGTDSLNLMANGTWLEEVKLTLYAYDSGTDSGNTYSSANSDTQPAEKISKIEVSPMVVNGALVPIGNMTFRKTN